MAAELLRREYKTVIADESHYIKNAETKRTKAVVPLLTSADHAILLTGTPALSRPRELWTQLCAVRPDVFDLDKYWQYETYAKRYCGAYEDQMGQLDDRGNFHSFSTPCLLVFAPFPLFFTLFSLEGHRTWMS